MVNVFLGYHSELVGTRLVEMLYEIKNVQVAGYVFRSDSLPAALDACTPDVAILDMRLLHGAQIHDFAGMKLRYPSVRFILMYDYPFTRFSRECLRFGAEYCFDTLHEFQNLGSIINRISAQRSLSAVPLSR